MNTNGSFDFVPTISFDPTAFFTVHVELRGMEAG